MSYCNECGKDASVWYCGFKKIDPENYQRALMECKKLSYYCEKHIPSTITNDYTTFAHKTPQILESEFIQMVERDLNKLAENLPEFLDKNYEQISNGWKFSNLVEFLIDWCIRNCESSYCSAYKKKYNNSPSYEQNAEILNIIERRRIQIEQGVLFFLDHTKFKKIIS